MKQDKHDLVSYLYIYDDVLRDEYKEKFVINGDKREWKC